MPPSTTDNQFSPPLQEILEDSYDRALRRETIVFILDDLYSVNEHFQAVLDWFKEKGNKVARRWGAGCQLASDGWLYFVGADTHVSPTRGASVEHDLRPYAHELVRQRGLQGLLAKAAAKSSKECCGAKDRGEAVCQDCPAVQAA